MKLKEWFRNQVAAITFAVSNVEKNVLNQEGKNLDENIGLEKRHTQGTLADALVHGELTQEVKNLRWRMYKVLQASEKINVKITGGLEKETGDYDADIAAEGLLEDVKIETTYESVDQRKLLAKVKLDNVDTYELEMVVDNSEIGNGFGDYLDNIKLVDNVVNGKEYHARNKTDKPVKVVREFMPKFQLEDYTKKLNIRKINDDKRLIEFYVSKYPDEYNPNSVHFVREIKRVIENGPRHHNFLEIKEVGFVTNKTLGVSDFLCYGYGNISFDKIVDFDGYYVIKFIADVVINGTNLLEDFVEHELEEKYKNKEAKKVNL